MDSKKQLMNESNGQQLAAEVITATGLKQRSKGLLGRSSFPNSQALWIHHCNSIHTWFMRFSIDVVFVDKKLSVKAVYHNVKPWRLIWPIFSAKSVFEFAAGQLEGKVKLGDQLNVVG